MIKLTFIVIQCIIVFIYINCILLYSLYT